MNRVICELAAIFFCGFGVGVICCFVVART